MRALPTPKEPTYNKRALIIAKGDLMKSPLTAKEPYQQVETAATAPPA